MDGMKAGIPADELLARPLAELSAVEFLEVLRRDDIADAASIRLLPDKKKYELWVDEEPILRRPLGEILDIIRSEKKKLELEKWRFEDVKLAVEDVVNPIERLGDPLRDRAVLVEEIANAVVRKMRG